MTDLEIFQTLGGSTAIARLLGIKASSVHEWLEAGIPEGRLIQLAAHLEKESNGRFTRKDRFPEKYIFYWPELAFSRMDSAGAATENVAVQGA